ncbi:MAG: SurA N-terminal domain-containing protein [Candidatus Paceibacterota bacterium]
MDEQTNPTQQAPAGGKNKFMLYATIAIVLLLALGAGYLFMTNDSLSNLPGIPTDQNTDGAVATVNGEEISREAYNNATTQLRTAAQAQGATLTDVQLRDQVLNSLINNRLLVQAARDAGVSASETEIQAEYELVVENAGGAEAFSQQLEALDITDAEVRTELSEQLTVNSFLLASINSEGNVTVSDEEVTAFYTDLTANNEDVPPLEEIRTQIEEQVRFQKQQQAIAGLVETLRANAEIEILI